MIADFGQAITSNLGYFRAIYINALNQFIKFLLVHFISL